MEHNKGENLHAETQELLERCRKMDKELNDIQKRVSTLQNVLDGEVRKRKKTSREGRKNG